MYDNGDYVSADPYKAFEYYRMAAEQGNDVGKFNLGICYLTGLGTEPNIEQGKYWLGQIQEDSSINETAKNILSYCFNKRQPFSHTSVFSKYFILSEDERNQFTQYLDNKNYTDEIAFYKKLMKEEDDLLIIVSHFRTIIWVIYTKMASVFHKITRKPLNIITKLQS